MLASNSSSAKNRVVDPIDIRRMALRAFRDHLVLPIVDRVSAVVGRRMSSARLVVATAETMHASSIAFILRCHPTFSSRSFLHQFRPYLPPNLLSRLLTL